MKPRIKSEPIIIHARKLIDVVKLENKCSYRTAIRNVDDYAMIVIPVRTTSKK